MKQVAQDARELRRAVAINILGYVLKLSLPLLLAFATRAYGASRWGVFVAVQSLVLVIARPTVLGFDKAMLWWVGARGEAETTRIVRSSVVIVGTLSIATTCLVALLADEMLLLWTKHSSESHETLASGAQVLRIMLLGVPPFVITELLLHACMGLRRMEPQVVIRDTVNPIALIGSALVFYAQGWHETGLAWAFSVSHWLSFLLAVRAYAQIFPRTEPRHAAKFDVKPAPGFVAYAWPMWLSEMANGFLLRMDTLVLMAFTDPFTVGVWGIVSQFGNAIRSIRRAFDPIVTALSARISQSHDLDRLRQSYSYAAQLVSLTQIPIFAFLFLFSDVLLPLYGQGFERGSVSLTIVGAFWLVNGATGLAGVVVGGYGYARVVLLNVLFTIVVQGIFLILLVPKFGLIGAAIAVGGSYTAQNVVQLIEMKLFTGGFHFTSRALQPLGPAMIGIAMGALLGWGAMRVTHQVFVVRGAAAVGFLSGYGLFLLRDRRLGKLRAPG